MFLLLFLWLLSIVTCVVVKCLWNLGGKDYTSLFVLKLVPSGVWKWFQLDPDVDLDILAEVTVATSTYTLDAKEVSPPPSSG